MYVVKIVFFMYVVKMVSFYEGFRLNYLTIDNASCIYRDPFVVL